MDVYCLCRLISVLLSFVSGTQFSFENPPHWHTAWCFARVGGTEVTLFLSRDAHVIQACPGSNGHCCRIEGTVVKNLHASAGDTGDSGSVSGLGRSCGGGNGSPLQYSCLEIPMGRGVWHGQAIVQGFAESQTQLSMHAYMWNLKKKDINELIYKTEIDSLA